MDVLVGYATAHGSTEGVADRIAARLRASGAKVTLAKLVDIDDVGPFDATIIGSAVHSGQWLPEAELFVDAHASALAARPTWLFSVCSVGETNSFFSERVGGYLTKARKDSKPLSRWLALFGADHHRYFTGMVQRGDWPGLGTLFLRAMGGSFGDHRDWADIEAWADSIGLVLAPEDKG